MNTVVITVIVASIMIFVSQKINEYYHEKRIKADTQVWNMICEVVDEHIIAWEEISEKYK